MSFIIVVLCLALLIVLISYFKVDAFIAFLISSILAGIALGIPLEKLPDSVNNGIGSILGGLTLIIVLGAMLGKLVAESGAAQKIASVMVSLFGTKHIQWGLMVTGFVVGIPLFYGIGFVLLVQASGGLYRVADVGGVVRDAWIPAPASVSGSLGGTVQREYRPYADLRFMFGDSGYHYRRAGVRQSVETYKIRSGHVVRAERG